MRLQEDAIEVATPSGAMHTRLYWPEGGGRYPGLVLQSEIYQCTAPIARLAARLAGEGYLVAVPDIYHEFLPAGLALGYDTAGTDRGNALKTTKAVAAWDADNKALLEALLGQPSCSGRLGAIGFCIGGHLAFRTALQPTVLSTACFYATDLHTASLGADQEDDSLVRAGDVRGELLMIWGRQDPHVPLAGRRAIYERLAETERTFTWHEFNAEHAFMRDEGRRFDPTLSRLGIDLVLELFGRTLK